MSEALEKSKRLVEQILEETKLPPDVRQNLEDARRALMRDITLSNDKQGRIIKIDVAYLERWRTEHADSVHDAIKAMDRQTMESVAAAPFIAVSNDTGGGRKK